MLPWTMLAFVTLAQEKPAPAPAPEEEIVEVHKGNLVPSVELEVTFESIESVEIKPRMENWQGDMTIVRVVPSGSAVRKGDVILALDSVPLQRALAAAEIDLRVARATLEKAEADQVQGEKADALALLQAETAVKDALETLRAFDEVEGKNMLKTAELNLKYSEDGIRDQQEELAQLEKMYKTEQLTNDTAEIVVRRARRTLERAKVALEMTRGESEVVRTVKHPQLRQTHLFSVDNAKRALEVLKIQQGLGKVQREAELAKAKAAVSLQEDQLAKLRRDFEACTVRSPFDGRVYYGQLLRGAWATADQVAPFLHPGDKVQPGLALLSVCGLPTRAVAEVSEPDYFDIAVDQAATVTPAALPDLKRDGTIRQKGAIIQSKSQATALDALIELKDPFTELFPGMKGKATIHGKELKEVVLVPTGAVSTHEGKSTVNVSKDGKSSPREVTLGKTDGKMTQVKSGLEAGEKIGVPK
jgi:multidrug efflux pump subunit AcrA (membrane-fusion protein)